MVCVSAPTYTSRYKRIHAFSSIRYGRRVCSCATVAVQNRAKGKNRAGLPQILDGRRAQHQVFGILYKPRVLVVDEEGLMRTGWRKQNQISTATTTTTRHTRPQLHYNLHLFILPSHNSKALDGLYLRSNYDIEEESLKLGKCKCKRRRRGRTRNSIELKSAAWSDLKASINHFLSRRSLSAIHALLSRESSSEL